MTSIDMVEVMLGVEAEFDVAIPPAEITMDNFRSVAAMVSLVSRLRPTA
jgi:acyl carrier protein